MVHDATKPSEVIGSSSSGSRTASSAVSSMSAPGIDPPAREAIGAPIWPPVRLATDAGPRRGDGPPALPDRPPPRPSAWLALGGIVLRVMPPQPAAATRRAPLARREFPLAPEAGTRRAP